MTLALSILATGALQSIPADTVAVVASRSALEAAADVSLVVLLLLAVIGTVGLLMFVRQMNRLARHVTKLTHQLERQVDPVLDRARSVARNVDFIAEAIRGDVERLTGSVHVLSDRLQQASDHMEERIDEFNALIEVVQSEAEGIFLDTASAVRGVRAGARALDPGQGETMPARQPDSDPSAVDPDPDDL